jgi:hypothetical protein
VYCAHGSGKENEGGLIYGCEVVGDGRCICAEKSAW